MLASPRRCAAAGVVGRFVFRGGGVADCDDPVECRATIGGRRIEIIGTDLARDQVTRGRAQRSSRCSAACRCRC